MGLIELDSIKAAKNRLQHIIMQHPLAYAPRLSNIANAKVYLKKENLQPTGAFKIRGAFNKIATLKELDSKNNTQNSK